MKELVKNWQCSRWIFDCFQISSKLWLYTIINLCFFLRIIGMNPKNHPDNQQEFLPISNNQPTLVWTNVRHLVWQIRTASWFCFWLVKLNQKWVWFLNLVLEPEMDKIRNSNWNQVPNFIYVQNRNWNFGKKPTIIGS